jgi:glycosyltransferase involved in cell wall biosynthesis
MNFSRNHMKEVADIAQKIDIEVIEEMINVLVDTKKNRGRLFILGIGGSAGNASHAVNDFRKLANIESYAPTDNVSEMISAIQKLITNKILRFKLGRSARNKVASNFSWQSHCDKITSIISTASE